RTAARPLPAARSVAGPPPASRTPGARSDLDRHTCAVAEQVHRVGEPDDPRLVAHRDRVRAGTVLEELDAAQQVAVGDAGGAEDDHLTRGQVLGAVDAVHRTALLLEAPALLVVARPEAPVDLAAEALQRGRRQHALRGAADAHHGVHVGAAHRRRQRRDHVAVADQLDARARLAHLAD